MYYIGTKQQCENYNLEVTQGENYQGSTTTWASVTQHPTEGKYAIVAHEKYSSNLESCKTLSNDWYNDETI